MKTIEQLEEDIISFTAKIQEDYPELSKYIGELPKNNSENEEVTTESLENYYRSLQDIVSQYAKTTSDTLDNTSSQTAHYEDLQIYPPSEDIYQQFKEEADLNPEDISKMKSPNEVEGLPNELGFSDAMSGSDLDVPGSDLDDQQERIGSEDEENNYYSLGGDNHNDLEEDNG